MFIRTPPVRSHPELTMCLDVYTPAEVSSPTTEAGCSPKALHIHPAYTLLCWSREPVDPSGRSGFHENFCQWNPLEILGGSSCSFRMDGASNLSHGRCWADLKTGERLHAPGQVQNTILFISFSKNKTSSQAVTEKFKFTF